MFYFGLDHAQISHQIAGLINSYNQLTKKRSGSNIQNGHTNYIVETHGGWVLGAVGLDRQSYTFTEIKHLVVAPEWRKQGIAKHLLKRALGMINTKMVYATIRDDNESSLELFESLGFQRSGDYPTENHKVTLLVKVNSQWEKIKSASQSHWLNSPE